MVVVLLRLSPRILMRTSFGRSLIVVGMFVVTAVSCVLRELTVWNKESKGCFTFVVAAIMKSS